MSVENCTNNGAILITGASSGIGEACALHLAQRGYLVFAGVRKEADGQRLFQNFQDGQKNSHLGQLVPVLLDVTDAQSVAQAVETISQKVEKKGLAGLVNNAGVGKFGPAEFYPGEEIRYTFEVNFFGLIAVTQSFLPLIRQGHGRIINIGSMGGIISTPFQSIYSASKFAVEGFTDALRIELKPWEIPVSIIRCGCVDTPIFNKGMQAAQETLLNISPQGLSLYAKYFNAAIDAAKLFFRKAIPAEKVAVKVAKTLRTKNPRAHYYSSLDIRLMAILLKQCPVSLKDWFIRKVLGLAN